MAKWLNGCGCVECWSEHKRHVMVANGIKSKNEYKFVRVTYHTKNLMVKELIIKRF